MIHPKLLSLEGVHHATSISYYTESQPNYKSLVGASCRHGSNHLRPKPLINKLNLIIEIKLKSVSPEA